MPRKVIIRPCSCGCGDNTKGGRFIPGHDAKLISALIEAVGGIENLRTLVEEHVGRKVVPFDLASL